MTNNIMKEIFGPIRADAQLKERTQAFLAQKTRRYAQAGEKKRGRRVYAVACALLMLLGGHWLYFTPTAKISIDINPSIELGINRLDRVILVDGLNEDGQALSRALDVKHRHYAEAVEQIVHCDSITALLSGDEVMVITVIGADGRQSAQILSDVELCTANQSNTHCCFARPEEVAAAHETGLSCGKYRAFLELRLLDPEITPEAVQGMTMREIQDWVDCHTAEHGAPSSDNVHHRHGGGHGNGRRSSE